jgi:hypothetical protein
MKISRFAPSTEKVWLNALANEKVRGVNDTFLHVLVPYCFVEIENFKYWFEKSPFFSLVGRVSAA